MTLRGFGSGAAVLAVVFTFGCGSDKQPPEGGLYLEIGSSSSPPEGKTCSVKAHQTSIGTVPPSQTTKGKPVVDGDNGAHVSCGAAGGGTVKFHGTISKGNVSFQITSGVVDKGGTGTALIQEYDPEGATALQTPPDQPCTIDVSKEKLTAGDGIVWAAISCPALISSNQPNLFCAAPNGTFLLQNCD